MINKRLILVFVIIMILHCSAVSAYENYDDLIFNNITIDDSGYDDTKFIDEKSFYYDEEDSSYLSDNIVGGKNIKNTTGVVMADDEYMWCSIFYNSFKQLGE